MFNRILSALGKEDLTPLLSPSFEACELSARQQLDAPNRQISHVYFIETGIAAVFSTSKENSIAVGLIGCEGVSAISVILGDDRSPYSTVMLCDGTALRISVDALLQEMAARPQLNRLLLRYVIAFNNQMSHNALANVFGLMEQRVARFLLMAHDRLAADTIPITQQQIADVIGIWRPRVTTALNQLARLGMIEVERGLVRVLDRKAIEKLAGTFYGLAEKEYVRTLGITPSDWAGSPQTETLLARSRAAPTRL